MRIKIPIVIINAMIINEGISKKFQKYFFESLYPFIRTVCLITNFLKIINQNIKNINNEHSKLNKLICPIYENMPIFKILTCNK